MTVLLQQIGTILVINFILFINNVNLFLSVPSPLDDEKVMMRFLKFTLLHNADYMHIVHRCRFTDVDSCMSMLNMHKNLLPTPSTPSLLLFLEGFCPFMPLLLKSITLYHTTIRPH